MALGDPISDYLLEKSEALRHSGGLFNEKLIHEGYTLKKLYFNMF